MGFFLSPPLLLKNNSPKLVSKINSALPAEQALLAKRGQPGLPARPDRPASRAGRAGWVRPGLEPSVYLLKNRVKYAILPCFIIVFTHYDVIINY